MCALSNFGACVGEHHTFNASISIKLDFRPTIFLIPKREADVFESSREAPTASSARFLLFGFYTLFPSKFIARGFNHLRNTYRTGSRCAYAHRIAVAQGILQAEHNRVHTEFFRKFRDLQFRHKQRLRRAKSTEGCP